MENFITVNKQSIIILGSILLTIACLLAAPLSLFHHDYFYHFGYQHNGAYEKLDKKIVNDITDNFQNFLTNKEPLNYFKDNQASHLHDVKQLYWKLRTVFVISLLSSLLLILFLSKNNRTTNLQKLFLLTSIFLCLTILLLFFLSLSWNWFFETFHKMFFADNWIFPYDSLMIQLWGGNFFPLAAAISGALILLCSIFFFLASCLLKKIT